MANLASLKKDLRSLGTPERAKACAWFFKTGPGQYGEGDVFLGLTVPAQRTIAKKYADLSLADIESLLQSKEHEFRLTALIILVNQYRQAEKAADLATQKKIYSLYIKNTKWINNWDLVDTSAEIVGKYLVTLPGKTGAAEKIKVLTKLAQSKLLWGRRIAMIATFTYIRKGRHEEALRIAEMLLRTKDGKPEHDLIQKAVGWMLREVGKSGNLEAEVAFIHKHIHVMGRTTLRYAIERFPKHERQMYLSL